MSILNRLQPLLSPVFKRIVLLEQTGVFRRVCSISKPRCRSLRASRRSPAPSAWCPLRHHSPICQFDSTRWRSGAFGESGRPEGSAGAVEEETHQMDSDLRDDSDLSPSSSEAFTLDVLVSLLRQENAEDICVIKVPEQIKYTEFFIVVSGVSPRHLRAMALYAVKVYKFLKKNHDPHVKIEGKDAEDWMCIDFGNMVVHFMLPEARELYELEKLWTLRSFDEQLKRIPAETLPEDFIYDLELTK